MPQFWQEEILSYYILPRTGLSVQNISHPHFLLIHSAALKTRLRRTHGKITSFITCHWQVMKEVIFP